MRRLLLTTALCLCSASSFGYTWLNNTCSQSTSSGTTISCTLPTSLSAHQTIIVWGMYGHGLNPGCTFTDSSGGATGGSESILANTALGMNGVGGTFCGRAWGNGTFTGSDTITLTAGPVADFMYFQATVYDVGGDPTFDSTGFIQGADTCTTTDTSSYTTHNSGELLFAVHGWSGTSGSSETLSPGSGESQRINNPNSFSITAGQMGFLAEDQSTFSPTTYTSTATSNLSANCWNGVVLGIIPTGGGGGGGTGTANGEKQRRVAY